jgi:hypothetical protein
MTRLYASQEDGQLYPESAVESPRNYTLIEVLDVVTLTPEQLCVGYGQILQILLQSGQAREIS